MPPTLGEVGSAPRHLRAHPPIRGSCHTTIHTSLLPFLGRYKEALEHGEMAVKYAPFDPQARRNLAKVYDAMGNTA